MKSSLVFLEYIYKFLSSYYTKPKPYLLFLSSAFRKPGAKLTAVQHLQSVLRYQSSHRPDMLLGYRIIFKLLPLSFKVIH